MPRPLRFVLLLLALSVARAEEPSVILTVRRDGAAPLTFSATTLAALPHVELTATDPHEKKEHRFTGIPVREVLARAGVPLGEKLRGPVQQLGVVVRAKDGYAVLFALAEFDESFSDRTLLLADRLDGQPLPEKSAPLQLIAPGDKKAARWTRMVTSLEIVSIPAKP